MPSRVMAQASLLSGWDRCRGGCGSMASRVTQDFPIRCWDHQRRINLLHTDLYCEKEDIKRIGICVGQGFLVEEKSILLLRQLRRKNGLQRSALLKSMLRRKNKILKKAKNQHHRTPMRKRYLHRAVMGVRRFPPPLNSKSAPKRQQHACERSGSQIKNPRWTLLW